MFRVVSFPLIGTCFQHTEWYFTQMCALKILKTLIWLPTHLPKVTFFKLELCEGEMHFQLSLSPKWVQSRVQWAVGGSAKCKQTFDQLLSSFARFPTDLDPLWASCTEVIKNALGNCWAGLTFLSLSPKWLKQTKTYLSSLHLLALHWCCQMQL